MNMLKTVISVLVLVLPFAANAETFTFPAKDIFVEGDNLVVGSHINYPVITSQSSSSLRRKHPKATTCFDDEQRLIDCRMVLSVGFINEASITVTDGAVSNISIIVIHQ